MGVKVIDKERGTLVHWILFYRKQGSNWEWTNLFEFHNMEIQNFSVSYTIKYYLFL